MQHVIPHTVFTVHEHSLVCEASDLTGYHVGAVLRIQGRQHVAEFARANVRRRDGEIESVVFRPTPKTLACAPQLRDVRVVVFND